MKHYFFDDKINLENFESIDKKHYKSIDIYYIRYIMIKKIGDCKNIHSVNPLYLIINQASRYTEEKKWK